MHQALHVISFMMSLFFSVDSNIGCLQDKPASPMDYHARLEQYMQLDPGHRYGSDKQCEMVYGPGAKICPYMVSNKTKATSSGSRTIDFL